MMALRYHLFKHPLYSKVPESANPEVHKKLNVLVVGFGNDSNDKNYGQQFLDLCLQVGQIYNTELNVTVMAEDMEDKENYIKTRPELENFFNIDQKTNDQSDMYGNICFVNYAENPEDILSEVKPHYIFIALGSDEKNRSYAQECRKAIDDEHISCVVNFVCVGSGLLSDDDEKIVPVLTRSDEGMENDPLRKVVEEKAFAVHLVWYKNLNIDIDNLRKEFTNQGEENKYNHDSCVSNLLSLKYKLHSLGIDGLEMENDILSLAAREFIEKVTAEQKKILAWLEHKRWVTEIICHGWKHIADLSRCAKGRIKPSDKVKRLHVCIVKSSPDTPLEKYNCEQWDKGSIECLDPLDTISVELHRAYAEYAKGIDGNRIAHELAEIQSLAVSNREMMNVFQGFYLCQSDIRNGDNAKVCLYDGLKEALRNEAEKLAPEKSELLMERIETFDRLFTPILRSMEYKDYKKIDVDMIDTIPFILTYSDSTCMVIPWDGSEDTRDTTVLLSKVAAATIINPKRIIYFCFFNNEKEAEILFNDSLKAVQTYMKKKKLRAQIELAIVCNADIKKHTALMDGFKIDFWLTESQFAEQSEESIGLMKRDSEIFVTERIANNAASILLKACDGLGHYKFDMNSLKFEECEGCDFFQYIPVKVNTSVADILVFCDASNKSNSVPDFFNDYTTLWKKYTEVDNDNKPTLSVWKEICGKLANAAQDEIIFSSNKNRESKGARSYLLPIECRAVMERMLSFLVSHGFLDTNTYVNEYTPDTFQVVVYDDGKYEEECKKLFSDPYRLILPGGLDFYVDNRGNAHVKFLSLVVSGTEVAELTSTKRKRELLDFFRDMKYINMAEDGGFSYVSYPIRQLMTSEGRMLEVYTYHKAKETGYFDDVASGFEIEWTGCGESNECDCILTKGFNVLFVECKACNNLPQKIWNEENHNRENLFQKLKRLTRRLGVNAQPVLIIDLRGRGADEAGNQALINQWRNNGIIIISDPSEIDDIGMTLKNLMESLRSREQEV